MESFDFNQVFSQFVEIEEKYAIDDTMRRMVTDRAKVLAQGDPTITDGNKYIGEAHKRSGGYKELIDFAGRLKAYEVPLQADELYKRLSASGTFEQGRSAESNLKTLRDIGQNMEAIDADTKKFKAEFIKLIERIEILVTPILEIQERTVAASMHFEIQATKELIDSGAIPTRATASEQVKQAQFIANKKRGR